MSNEKALKVSAVLQGVAEGPDEFLQGVAEGLDEFLEVAAGERIGFAMVLKSASLSLAKLSAQTESEFVMEAGVLRRITLR
jgi:hypothetical protein